MRGYTRTEIEKAVKRLRKVRREIRMMRKLMMMKAHNNEKTRRGKSL